MAISDIFFLEPYIWLGMGGVIVLLAGLLPHGKVCAYYTAIIVLIGTIISCFVLFGVVTSIEKFVQISHFMLGCCVVFCLTALAVLFIAKNSLIEKDLNEIFYSLILFATLGASLLPNDHLVAFLLGIEIIVICNFALIAWNPRKKVSVEASMKFIIAASLATGFLFMGIALIYLGSGTLILSKIYESLNASYSNSILTAFGIILVLSAAGFELAVAPFHMWIGDFYEGASTPVVAFIGTIPKIAVLAWGILLPIRLSTVLWEIFEPFLQIISIISMIFGTLFALHQTRFKRILAYSSIAHFGFILAALAIYRSESSTAIMYYGISYTVMTLAILAILTALEKKAQQPLTTLEDLSGIGYRYPYLGVSFAIIILSLAGLPPFTGFFAKLLILQIIIKNHEYLLASTMIITSAVGLYYYLRSLSFIFKNITENTPLFPEKLSLCQRSYLSGNTVILISTLLTLFIGVSMQPILNYLSTIFPY